MNVELKGIIHAIFAEQEVGNRGFKKKEIVITVDHESSYPQHVICQAVQSKTELLNGFTHGQMVKVNCNLKGKESNGRYFNSLEIWKIENI